MTDITIPADVAKQIANVLRGIRIAYPERCDEWADLLDQPAPSLRDEVAELLRGSSSGDRWDMADDYLAVVRRHVEALTLPDQPSLPSAWGNGWLACNADVLRLLGGDDGAR